MRPERDRPLDMTGLTDEERVEISTQLTAQAIKVGYEQARSWARQRIAEIRAERGA